MIGQTHDFDGDVSWNKVLLADAFDICTVITERLKVLDIADVEELYVYTALDQTDFYAALDNVSLTYPENRYQLPSWQCDVYLAHVVTGQGPGPDVVPRFRTKVKWHKQALWIQDADSAHLYVLSLVNYQSILMDAVPGLLEALANRLNSALSAPSAEFEWNIL